MVAAQFPIPDMVMFPLKHAAGKLTLLRNDQHMLRRFGQLDVLELDANKGTGLPLRGEADTFIFPINGLVNTVLVDLRENSPSHDARVAVTLNAEDPNGLIVPYGVACRLDVPNHGTLVVLSTHSEQHPNDRELSSEELAGMLS